MGIPLSCKSIPSHFRTNLCSSVVSISIITHLLHISPSSMDIDEGAKQMHVNPSYLTKSINYSDQRWMQNNKSNNSPTTTLDVCGCVVPLNACFTSHGHRVLIVWLWMSIHHHQRSSSAAAEDISNRMQRCEWGSSRTLNLPPQYNSHCSSSSSSVAVAGLILRLDTTGACRP